MTQTSLTSGFWISDWTLKIIPSKFQEGQHDYYAKKGMSLYVILILKVDEIR